MVLVRPEDRLLLGMKLKGQTFIDKTLPFRLRSVPLAVGDGTEWAMRSGGVECVFHYVDDSSLLADWALINVQLT